MPRKHRPIKGVEVATESRPLSEPRLIGTWKSDRRRTFENRSRSPKGTREGWKKFQAMFGKLTVKWTRSTVTSGGIGAGPPDKHRYQVVARDIDSALVLIRESDFITGNSLLAQVAMKVFDDVKPGDNLVEIHFEEDHYWIDAGGMVNEYFRRVTSPPTPSATRERR